MASFRMMGVSSGIKLETLTNQIPVMTSNTTPSGVASASGEWDGNNAAFRAFSDSYQWMSSSGQLVGAWIQYKFPTAKKIQILIVTNNQYRKVKSFKFQGSNDGQTYKDLADLTVASTDGMIDTLFIVPNSTSYLYYRLYVTEAGPTDPQINLAVGFTRIKMF